jgi:hypothetical protein
MVAGSLLGMTHKSALLGLCVFLTLACGKKGDPQPPLPRGPRAVSDLAIEQEGDDAVLRFSFPDRLLTGDPLTDLDSIEIFRVDKPPSELTAPRRTGAGAPPSSVPGAAGATGVVHLPGEMERREATNVRMAEEAFYRQAKRVASLSLPAIAEATHGATLEYRDSLLTLFTQEESPYPLAYAVVSVRRNKERSPLSNIVALTPDIAPQAPVFLEPIVSEGRICLEWTAPEKNVLQQPVEIAGYKVYRRPLSQEEYDQPLNPVPVPTTSFVDVGAPYGVPLAYTVRAVLKKNPKVEGLPADELALEYRDIYPPPAPARLDALSEASLVRLLWDPVDAPDLAGYVVYRAEGNGPFERLTKDPVTDPFFNDETAKPGKRYRYVVRAIDRAGNQSPPSKEATAALL